MGTEFDNQSNPVKIMKLLRPNEVAGLLNVSRSYAYLLIQTGAIPVVRIGKSCRVKPQDLQAFIDNHTHNQDPLCSIA
jgi:excisionase family DNA binding protein